MRYVIELAKFYPGTNLPHTDKELMICDISLNLAQKQVEEMIKKKEEFRSAFTDEEYAVVTKELNQTLKICKRRMKVFFGYLTEIGTITDEKSYWTWRFDVLKKYWSTHELWGPKLKPFVESLLRIE